MENSKHKKLIGIKKQGVLPVGYSKLISKMTNLSPTYINSVLRGTTFYVSTDKVDDIYAYTISLLQDVEAKIKTILEDTIE